jgi:hypothetical protein
MTALTAVALVSLWGQAEPAGGAARETANARAFLKLAQKTAGEYQLSAAGEPLQLRTKPVLRWTNPVVGEIYGGVFVWTKDGRPEVVVSIFKWYDPFTHMTLEFQSLSTQDIVAAKDGRRVWATSDEGVQWKAVPGAAAPAASSIARRSQMRALARQFSAQLTDKDGTRRQLRLLTQPLLRFSGPQKGLSDGAMFAFAQSTDPELLLLLAARPRGDAVAWQYALARLNFVPLQASHRGELIWEAPQLDSSEVYGDRSGAYTKFHVGKVKRR